MAMVFFLMMLSDGVEPMYDILDGEGTLADFPFQVHDGRAGHGGGQEWWQGLVPCERWL